MKHLSILRHAKAADPALYENDFDRPLTERGRKDVRAIARVVGSVQPNFDWILSSPSARTKQTTEDLLKYVRYEGPVIYEDQVYDASPKMLLGLLKDTPATVNHVLLVGHNTGLEDLIAGLCSGVPPHLTFRLATAGFVLIELDIYRWDQSRWGCGRLNMLMNPKILRRCGHHEADE